PRPFSTLLESAMSRRKHQSAASATSATNNPVTPRLPAAGGDHYHDSLPVRHRHAAGIDVGSRSHWVAALGAADTMEVAEFSAYTDGLLALVDWLRQRQVTTVALEATGIYGDPLFDLLQAEGFEVIQVNPAYAAQFKGRPKTDKRDCQWIQRL